LAARGVPPYRGQDRAGRGSFILPHRRGSRDSGRFFAARQRALGRGCLLFQLDLAFDLTREADTANGHRAEMRCTVVCSARQQLPIVERNHSSLAEIARVERSCEVVAARYLGATSTKPARAARMRS